MSIINTGYTRELSRAELLKNELATVRGFLADEPGNQFWQNRLAALEAEQQAAEIDEWLGKLSPAELSFVAWVTDDGCGNDDDILGLDGSETGISQPVIF